MLAFLFLVERAVAGKIIIEHRECELETKDVIQLQFFFMNG